MIYVLIKKKILFDVNILITCKYQFGISLYSQYMNGAFYVCSYPIKIFLLRALIIWNYAVSYIYVLFLVRPPLKCKLLESKNFGPCSSLLYSETLAECLIHRIHSTYVYFNIWIGWMNELNKNFIFKRPKEYKSQEKKLSDLEGFVDFICKGKWKSF